MDPLRKNTFDSIFAVKCGDATIDDCILNASQHIVGCLKKYDDALEKIKKNKSQYTVQGRTIQAKKASEIIQKELEEIQEKSSWESDIKKIEKKFDDIEGESDIRLLIREGREREVRTAMQAITDSLTFDKDFGTLIREGNPTVCGAVVNSPVKIFIDPKLQSLAVENYRLSQNPSAADRLSTLNKAQTIHENLFNFARQELDIKAVDKIAKLAAGK